MSDICVELYGEDIAYGRKPFGYCKEYPDMSMFGVENYISKAFNNELLEYRLFNGSIHTYHDEIVCANININYGSGHPYTFKIFNNYLNNPNEFKVLKLSGKIDGCKFFSVDDNYDWVHIFTNHKWEKIDKETIIKIIKSARKKEEYSSDIYKRFFDLIMNKLLEN